MLTTCEVQSSFIVTVVCHKVQVLAWRYQTFRCTVYQCTMHHCILRRGIRTMYGNFIHSSYYWYCTCSSLSRNDLFSQTKSLPDCSFSYLSEILLILNLVPRLNFSQVALLHWKTIWIQFHVEKSSLRLIYLSRLSLENFKQVLSQGELDFLFHNVIAFAVWFSSFSYFHQG